MKKKFISIFLCSMICSSLIACGNTTTNEETVDISTGEILIEETEPVVEEIFIEETEIEESIEEVVVEETIETTQIVKPLPSTIDLNNINDCTLHVSINENSFSEKEDGTYLNFKIYEYDLYDMVDISLLEKGSIIELRGEEVTIDTIDKLESGLISINGGEENGGYDLFTNEEGVYFETLMNDYKVFKEIGEKELKISPEFSFIDNIDIENPEKTYVLEDLIEETKDIYGFTEFNTTIRIENNKIIELIRNYTP